MSQSTPLKQLSVMAGNKGLAELHIPTITDDVEDVVGMQGRIRLQKNERVTTSQWMDKQRNNLQAYEYLCHIGEAKEWIENCLQDEIDPIMKLEESLRNGIVLARLARWMAPGVVRKIFCEPKLQFRHSDNINCFFDALRVVRLPSVFWFELTDLYDKKNMPKVIYCIHALSHLLARRHLAPNIKNLLGQLQFTNEELNAAQRGLDHSSAPMPNFKSVENWLSKELDDDEQGTGPVGLATPELVIEEDEEEDEEDEGEDKVETEEDRRARWHAYWSEPQHLDALILFQKHARGWVARRALTCHRQLCASSQVQMWMTKIQAHIRGACARQSMKVKRARYSGARRWMTMVQTACRSHLARAGGDDVEESGLTMGHAQRGYRPFAVYRRLATSRNLSVGNIKTFIHLLDDSDLDFDRELALEDLRQQVIELIRSNGELDEQVNMLDIQIGLFLRNSITMDDLLRRSSGVFQKSRQRRHLPDAFVSRTKGSQYALDDPYNLTGIDKTSRQRLELYEQLVYLLQTEPQYLARLLTWQRHQDLAYGHHKAITDTVLTLFGYATNSREEYLLIQLCKYCIREEIRLAGSAHEFMKGRHTFMKLIVQTNRGTKERDFFRKLLGPMVSGMVSNDFLDLDVDPVSIYHKMINEEEMETGQPSARRVPVTPHEALEDPLVRDRFILHVRNLQTLTDQFLTAITGTVDEIPFGIRVIASELRRTLEDTFRDEPRQSITKILGHFIYYRYLNPAIVAPEQYDVVDAIINPVQRKNLAEISKLLQRISSSKVYDGANDYLASLNSFVTQSGHRFAAWFMQLAVVEEPESRFARHALSDQTTTQKPVVYMLATELFHLHYIVETTVSTMDPDGPLCDIVEALGPSPYSQIVGTEHETDVMVRLTLSHPHQDQLAQDPEARLRHVLMDTLRLVTYVIKIQSGPHLRAIFSSDVAPDDEAAWQAFQVREFSGDEAIVENRRHVKFLPDEPPLDLKSLSFLQLKHITHRLVVHLVRCQVISEDNHYQDIITMIARDITGKNARRKERNQELDRLQQIHGHLRSKHAYLEDQRSQYEGYLTSCMTARANKSTHRRTKFILPLSRQYFHLRGLQKQGISPKFGSYRYRAKELFERGVLVDMEGVDKKHYDRIDIVLSMDQVGIISIDAKCTLWDIHSVHVDLPFDQLLHTQFEGVPTITMLDGMVRVNVNLLIYLINKKFYW